MLYLPNSEGTPLRRRIRSIVGATALAFASRAIAGGVRTSPTQRGFKRALTGALIGLLLSSCSQQPEDRLPATRRGTLNCTADVHVGPPLADSTDFYGPVALATRGDLPDPRPDGDGLWLKIGLWVMRGERVELESSSNVAHTGSLRWPNDQSGPVTALTSDGCAGDTEWLSFAGGIVVPSPRCFEMTISSNGNVYPVRIPMGAKCKGAP